MRLRDRLQNSMIGRNGPDEIGLTVGVGVIVCVVLRFIFRGLVSNIFLILAAVGIGYLYFRMFSKNVAKRRKENDAYRKVIYGASDSFRKKKVRFQQRKDYKFFKCPSCGLMLRVPRGKGRLRITCRKCGNTFEKKT